MQTRIKPKPGMAMSPEDYEAFILGEPDDVWELVRGRLRKKPLVSVGHADAVFELAFLLRIQLDRRVYRVSLNHARLKHGDCSYFVPDDVVLRVADLVGDTANPWRLMPTPPRRYSSRKLGRRQLAGMTLTKSSSPTRTAATWRSGGCTPSTTR